MLAFFFTSYDFTRCLPAYAERAADNGSLSDICAQKQNFSCARLISVLRFFPKVKGFSKIFCNYSLFFIRGASTIPEV